MLMMEVLPGLAYNGREREMCISFNVLSKRMQRHFLHMTAFTAFFLLSVCFITLHLLVANAIETPQYTVLRSGPDYEIRLYKYITWMSAPVQGPTSFQKATKDGFHRLYQYTHGANLNSSQLAITAPVLTSFAPSPQLASPAYSVKLFLPPDQGTLLPLPNPELNLKLDRWRARCVAVRKFPGFAKDDNVNQETGALEKTLNDHSSSDAIVQKDRGSYAIAQYNDSIRLSERVNEVWMDISSIKAEGCLSIQDQLHGV